MKQNTQKVEGKEKEETFPPEYKIRRLPLKHSRNISDFIHKHFPDCAEIDLNKDGYNILCLLSEHKYILHFM